MARFLLDLAGMLALAKVRKPQGGAAMIELALAVVVFMILVIGVLDFGRVGYARSRLKYAVTQATRFATTGNALVDPNNPGQQLSRLESVKSMVMSLSGLSDVNKLSILITAVTEDGRQLQGPGGPGDVVTVRANYRVKLVAPFLAPILPGGELEISASTTFRNEEFNQNVARALLPQAALRARV